MSIYKMLYPWQKKIVDKYFDKTSFGLFLDMGLGKTPLSLAFAEQHQCDKILIVSINSKVLENQDVSGSWFWWLSKSNINYRLCDKHTSEFKLELQEAFLVNYEMLFKRKKSDEERRKSIELNDKISAFIKSCKKKKVAIIIDESHKTKSNSSKQTSSIEQIKKLLQVSASEVYTYLLTGTPFTTGYIDLYTQLKLLGCKMTKQMFKDQYCVMGNVPGLLGWQQPIVGYRNVDMLYGLIHKYAITIESEDVMDLPEKIFIEHKLDCSDEFLSLTMEKRRGEDILSFAEKHNVDLSKEEFHRYNKHSFDNNPFYRNAAYPDEIWLSETIGTFWMRARQMSIGFQGNAEKSKWYDTKRLEELKRLLEQNENNYLIFYNYTPEMLQIYDICEELGYNIDIYCGEIKSLQFYEQYANQSFSGKTQNTKNVIIANYASGSTGMNWQEYHNCILFSLPLYKDYSQGIKRIHRSGQKFDCIYHMFYQDNWLDRGLLDSLNKSIDYNEKMFETDLKRVQEIMQKED